MGQVNLSRRLDLDICDMYVVRCVVTVDIEYEYLPTPHSLIRWTSAEKEALPPLQQLDIG